MMGGCRCSYKTCKSATKTHQELHFFHYPVKTRDRCMEWIQNADRIEFSYLPNDQLRNKVVCGLHFKDSCFTNELRKRLVHDAVPTLDVGCEEPDVDANVNINVDINHGTVQKTEHNLDLDYIDMEGDGLMAAGDSDDSNSDSNSRQAFMTGAGSIATIKATSGDGTSFSLDTTDPYVEMAHSSQMVTYNFVDGSLVPAKKELAEYKPREQRQHHRQQEQDSLSASPISMSSSGNSRNSNVRTERIDQHYQNQTYESIFGDDPSDPSDPCDAAPTQYMTETDCRSEDDETEMQAAALIINRHRSKERAGRPSRAIPTTPSSAATAVAANRVGERASDRANRLNSYVLSYIQDPLANIEYDKDDGRSVGEGDGDDDDMHAHAHMMQRPEHARTHSIASINIRRSGCDNINNDDDYDDDDDGEHSSEDCIIQLETDLNGDEMQNVHILPGSHVYGHGHGHDFNDGLDAGEGGIMVSAEEIVPDNRARHHHLSNLIDISGDDDDDDVIVCGGSLFGGDVDMELVPPESEPEPLLLVPPKPPAHQPVSLLQRALQPKPQRTINNNNGNASNKVNKVVRIQQTDIIRAQSAAPSSQIHKCQQGVSGLPLPQPQQQRALGKAVFTYAATTPRTAPLNAMSHAIIPIPAVVPAPAGAPSPFASSQRTTTIIKSSMASHTNLRPKVCKSQVLRTQIQKIIQGGVTKRIGGLARKEMHRDVAASLAALRADLPPSMYSAIAIHVQRKRSFFDAAEIEFLTTLYTSTPKGYTTLRDKLGWELPDEDTVKELLELREH